jgi:hypothetical protein
MEKSLKLPNGRLASLAELQRKEELKRKVLDPPPPLFKEARKLILRKCTSGKTEQTQAIFERQPFGEIERLVTQKLLDVVKTLVKEELDNEKWLHLFARISNRSYEKVRVDIFEFLNTDVFNLSNENCVSFLDSLTESWNIDFATFGIKIIMNRRLGPEQPKRFEFVEQNSEIYDTEPGLEEFLDDSFLSGDASEEEIESLKTLRFDGLRPLPYTFTERRRVSETLSIFETGQSNGRALTDGTSGPSAGAGRRWDRGRQWHSHHAGS